MLAAVQSQIVDELMTGWAKLYGPLGMRAAFLAARSTELKGEPPTGLAGAVKDGGHHNPLSVDSGDRAQGEIKWTWPEAQRGGAGRTDIATRSSSVRCRAWPG